MKKAANKGAARISARDIQKFRLSKNETKVLEKTTFVPQRLAEIEKSSGLAHTTVYEALIRLRERTLIVSIGEGRARRWLGIRVDKPGDKEEAKCKDVQTSQGRKEILSLISELFIKHKGDRLLSFHGEKVLEGWLSVLNKKDIEKRNIMIIENEIIVERYVPEHGYRRIFQSFPESWGKTMLGRTQITYFLPDEFFNSSTELMMFHDVAVVYETQLSRMIVFRNKETVKVYAAIFEMMRRLGRKVNSEEEFRMYIKR